MSTPDERMINEINSVFEPNEGEIEASEQLDTAIQSLYIACLRYTRAFQRDEIDHAHWHDEESEAKSVHKISVLGASQMLAYELDNLEEVLTKFCSQEHSPDCE